MTEILKGDSAVGTRDVQTNATVLGQAGFGFGLAFRKGRRSEGKRKKPLFLRLTQKASGQAWE